MVEEQLSPTLHWVGDACRSDYHTHNLGKCKYARKHSMEKELDGFGGCIPHLPQSFFLWVSIFDVSRFVVFCIYCFLKKFPTFFCTFCIFWSSKPNFVSYLLFWIKIFASCANYVSNDGTFKIIDVPLQKKLGALRPFMSQGEARWTTFWNIFFISIRTKNKYLSLLHPGKKRAITEFTRKFCLRTKILSNLIFFHLGIDQTS